MSHIATRILVLAGGALVATSALANDVSYKDDAPAAFNWTGVYTGGQVGWGRMKQTNNVTITHTTRTKKAVEDQLIADAYLAENGLRSRLKQAVTDTEGALAAPRESLQEHVGTLGAGQANAALAEVGAVQTLLAANTADELNAARDAITDAADANGSHAFATTYALRKNAVFLVEQAAVDAKATLKTADKDPVSAVRAQGNGIALNNEEQNAINARLNALFGADDDDDSVEQAVTDALGIFRSPKTGTGSGQTNQRTTSGLVYGGHVGAMYQFEHFIVGIEGRMDFGKLELNSVACRNLSAATCAPASKVNWLGAGLGRVGMAMDRWMAYGQFGLAWANMDGVSGDDDTVKGKAFGAGFSYAFQNNWILSVDYLRYKLDEQRGYKSQRFIRSNNQAGDNPDLAIESTVKDARQETTIDTITARVSYKF